ncbi:hypothetical protein LIER_16286 [Lithospermum erythrorhizon]|uniref:Uncharacterized protein n=1 Tax=Lithospermum erythrorhizon TaxID=34254 RepID=A0AAV3Q7I5_LITER
MNHQYAIQQQMMRSSVTVVSSSNGVVCPKPHRVSRFNTALYDPVCPLQWHVSQQQETCDAKAVNELLDIILAKGVNADGVEKQSAASAAGLVSSSPPFFSGSPPSRVSNPLIQDARFGHEVVTVSPRAVSIPSGLGSSPSSARMGGCVRDNFANNPAVRVEGFDCFNRNRRIGSIPTFA